MQVPSTRQFFLSHYGFQPALNIGHIDFRIFTYMREAQNEGSPGPFYTIWTEAEARNHNNQQIMIDLEGTRRPLSAVVSLDWPKPPEGQEDITPSIGWDCIVGIMAHDAKVSYRMDGGSVSNLGHWERLHMQVNQLREFGYLGWPGASGISGETTAEWMFRRAS
ncbi:hypothetical protein EG329_000298 [Mollisiaceae sp. DMI_Dod_QoI]|nr:hypothetical protein EG329_000298 [Helotiales sp. DMI_Dod_QoI]